MHDLFCESVSCVLSDCCWLFLKFREGEVGWSVGGQCVAYCSLPFVYDIVLISVLIMF